MITIDPWKGMEFYHSQKPGRWVVRRISDKEVYYSLVNDNTTYFYCAKQDFPRYVETLLGSPPQG